MLASYVFFCYRISFDTYKNVYIFKPSALQQLLFVGVNEAKDIVKARDFKLGPNSQSIPLNGGKDVHASSG